MFHLDKITQFAQQDDGGEDASVNLSAIAEASRKMAISVLQPGDHVHVLDQNGQVESACSTTPYLHAL
jgi:cold shock CspA family protein